MSDAGDEIQVDVPVEVEAKEVPKGKMSVEEALQVRNVFMFITPSALAH